ncbi:light-harvesting complex-like protein OHP1, chloroplastic [Punica granatum]|uniref:Light-harvesting complex-like protein OHP1, chloroplastic n=1 Tax=Punica granatum TaxID=22663 RepID=A0A218VWQ2_PUNGR|nr:light-harvesting complex-like protein OHP1, chloroplastic [Punica granatum]OWM64648.1 hypothetical protein CDL15_Pgr020615 [Punica granatum]
MAASVNISASSLIPTRALPLPSGNQRQSSINLHRDHGNKLSGRRPSFRVRAAKLPSGVELPKAQPKFQAPFVGFTRTAETWNSRACMIGLVGTFIVELIINRGILQVIGVEVGKGLNLPL